MGLISFILGRDSLGHPLRINYKGNQEHPSFLGAFISITITVLVTVQLLHKLTELLDMSDPSIQSYERPIYLDEIKEYGIVSLPEMKYHYGVYFEKTGGRPVEIPESVGRM